MCMRMSAWAQERPRAHCLAAKGSQLVHCLPRPYRRLPLKLLSRVRKKGSFGKGVFFEQSIFWRSRDSKECRDFREPPSCGKQRRIRPLSRDSREFRDFGNSRDSSGEETPLSLMTPLSGPDWVTCALYIDPCACGDGGAGRWLTCVPGASNQSAKPARVIPGHSYSEPTTICPNIVTS